MGVCMAAGPTVAEIHLQAFAHNIRLTRAQLLPSCHLMAVVKANAYGHGASQLAAAAIQQGVRFLAVAQCQEGVALRHEGIDVPIVVLGPIWPEDVDAFLSYDLRPMLGSHDDAARLQHAAERRGLQCAVHINIDTGMRRLGLVPSMLPAFLDKLATFAHLRVEGVMTHLATADMADTSTVEAQLRTFRQVVQLFAQRGLHPPYVHVANSAAIYRYPQSHYTLVRAGIALYGSHPFAAPAADALQPVLTWKTRLARVQDVPTGCGVGYGHTFMTDRYSLIGTLPVGYGDGLDYGLSNRGEVLVRGQRAPMIGRICMDMCMIDLTDIPQAQVGDEVTLIGAQGNERITAEDMARRCDRIPYDIFCAIGQRVARHYV